MVAFSGKTLVLIATLLPTYKVAISAGEIISSDVTGTSILSIISIVADFFKPVLEVAVIVTIPDFIALTIPTMFDPADGEDTTVAIVGSLDSHTISLYVVFKGENLT